jgi:hypothetical protein
MAVVDVPFLEPILDLCHLAAVLILTHTQARTFHEQFQQAWVILPLADRHQMFEMARAFEVLPRFAAILFGGYGRRHVHAPMIDPFVVSEKSLEKGG